jgi:hypothetical protein
MQNRVGGLYPGVELGNIGSFGSRSSAEREGKTGGNEYISHLDFSLT